MMAILVKLHFAARETFCSQSIFKSTFSVIDENSVVKELSPKPYTYLQGATPSQTNEESVASQRNEINLKKLTIKWQLVLQCTQTN